MILGVILIGAGLRTNSQTALFGSGLWTVALWVLGARIAWRTIVQATAGQFATDLIATLAIVAAVVLRQPLAGLIVVLMQTGGEALERHARGRASRALRALEEGAPRVAHRVVGEVVVDILADDVVPGDLLLIRPGEMIPCDAVVVDGRSHLDTSRLTGEPMRGDAVPADSRHTGRHHWRRERRGPKASHHS